MIATSAAKLPMLTNDIIREALTIYLSRPAPAPKVTASSSDEPTPPPVNKQGRLAGLLLSAVTFAEDVENEIREEILVQYVNVAYHPLVCQSVIHCFSTSLNIALQVEVSDRRGSTCAKRPVLTLASSRIKD